ncbi:MAG: hemerythrin domain-containing protein, partial [Angustibacter sp.]
ESTRSTTDLVDTSDMTTVHRFLRREFRLLPGVIGRVDDGDVLRATTVADHVELLTSVLHHHHTAEDDCLWPLLLERVPDELAPLVQLMEAQHHRVDELLQVIAAAVPPWRASAADGERDLLVGLLTELSAGLDEHMEAEEDHILPIAARTVSEAEWHAVGEAATAHHDKSIMPLLLGMIRYEGDPEVVAAMLAKAPRLVRLLAPALSGRAFRKHALAVHGTATPPGVGLRD